MRQYTIYTSPSQYGDGVTQVEAYALAAAERAAVLRRYPDAAVVLQNATGSKPATDDPEITAWTDDRWERILGGQPGNGAYVPAVVEAWSREGL